MKLFIMKLLCKEIICRKKIITSFCQRITFEITQKKFTSNFFSNLKNFNAFLVKVLNIVSFNKNRNLNVLYKRNSEVELHSSKSFFGSSCTNFGIFSHFACL